MIRNQFGFTLGGPIIKDSTFFFLDYEGFRQIQKQLVFSTVPELDQRNGILGVTVRDPATGTIYPAGTQIPLTSFARKVLNELPTPNIGGINAPGVTRANNFSELVLNQTFSDKFNIKIDHKINDQVNLFARVSHRKSNAFEAPTIPGPSGSNQNGFVNILNQQLAGGVTYVLKNASVFEARLGISKIEAGKRPPLSGGPSVFDLYGITGLPDDPTITGGLTTQTINGISQLGRQATNPQFQNPFSVNPRFNYAWTLGRHSLKTGYEFLSANTDVQDTNPLNGLDTYTGQFTRPAGAASNNLFNLADFFFGYRSQYELANALVLNIRQRLHFAYLQDDFKFGSRLTLNIGLRYEFSTPLYEKENRLSNYDPVTNSVIPAKDGSLFDRALVDPDYNNFAPRFGIAYNIFDKTVIRGGYGIGYVYFNRLGSANLLATNTPQITRSTITQGAPTATNQLCAGNNFADCFRTTQQGYPSGLPNTVTLFLPRETRTGYVQNWQLSIQREIAANTLIDLAYVGNHAVKLILLADYNQARPPLPGENVAATLQARRAIQGFGSISAGLPAGFSNYHSLQVKLERRFSKGLYLLSSFTWSKAIDNVGQSL
ncbi:MAG: TonB-dependent receptor domain-containing protein, partial [Pyrinomonadaceae bacterium]